MKYLLTQDLPLPSKNIRLATCLIATFLNRIQSLVSIRGAFLAVSDGLCRKTNNST